ncbi:MULTISPECIES: DUF4255 domain-containing protein [unclassified Mesorhizobium]|uniref:DUF4255 domain-containing protein n=1 Tax=unclassified Mesorhizobium TaxID=325217 RepID=UPI000F75A4A0|nr:MULTISPECIES: DUF4255 domain-containing protein [unclassified Mesorhizobium]AZO55764.1 DUF4255 domain-containing protein [Mesorhizobium sp. M8A.F.Ca.ET.057.01.1.1]RWE40342.1 MAG: DUF4255 domain-containing protein [Mesorhizobium sp.]
MGNKLSVAAVTASLQLMIQEAAGGATVKVGRPGNENDADVGPVVNVFLFQATPNAARRNAHNPTRSSNGQQVANSLVAFDLHYLISFIGRPELYQPELLLGAVSRGLEHRSAIARRTIDKVKQDNPGLVDVDLENEPEPVRIHPAPMSFEEMSKLWSVLFQTPYILSLAYTCSPVLIETSTPLSSGPPVTSVNNAVFVLGGPVVLGVEAAAGATAPVLWGGTLVVRGHSLDRHGMTLRIGGRDTDLGAARISSDRIELELVAASFGGEELAAGPLVLETVLPAPAGAPSHLERISDRATFLLRPQIKLAASATAGSKLTVVVSPGVGRGQTPRLVLNGQSATAASVQLNAEPFDSGFPVASLKFPLKGVPKGSYYAQLLVEGTASTPQVETDRTSPAFGQIVGPMLEVK